MLNLVQTNFLLIATPPRPLPARAWASGSPLSCRFFIPGEPRNKNAAPKLGRGVGGEGKRITTGFRRSQMGSIETKPAYAG
jgi:hypothetical protein